MFFNGVHTTKIVTAAPFQEQSSASPFLLPQAARSTKLVFLNPHQRQRPQLGEAEAVVICCARQPRGGVDANAAQYTQHTPVSDDDLY
jgi:hypothetical protein